MASKTLIVDGYKVTIQGRTNQELANFLTEMAVAYWEAADLAKNTGYNKTYNWYCNQATRISDAAHGVENRCTDEEDVGYGCDIAGYCTGRRCPMFFDCPDAC